MHHSCGEYSLLDLSHTHMYFFSCLWICFHDIFNLNYILIMQELEVEGELPEKVSCYQGVFYNYFSIGLYLNAKLSL